MRHSFGLALCLVTLVAFGQQDAKPTGDSPKPAAAAADKDPRKPFAETVKGADTIPGLFTLYRKEDKVFLEVRPEQFDRTYMFSVTCESGLGERGILASFMCGETAFSFHKSGTNVQMLLRSPIFTAAPDKPIRRAVDRSFASSVLGSTKIVSLPHPERKSELVELGPLLLTDVPMLAFELERTYRIPYRFDAKNSSFELLKSFEHNTEIGTVAHYAVEKPPVPPMLPPGAPPPPSVPPPSTLADVRSMLVHFRYSLSALPDDGYRPRLADDRVGHFFVQREDYSTDRTYRPTQRYISRWRLEKADPAAALSKPKQPIVFWLENTIPMEYRDAIREGVLMWNRAFQKIGFQDAVEVRQQPDDADWDPADVRYNTIRWLIATDAAFAIGPSRDNPFTGEKYDSDIGFSEALTRVTRREIAEALQPVSMPWAQEPIRLFRAPWAQGRPESLCTLGDGALREAEFGWSVLEARGMEPDSPEAEKYMKDFLRHIAAHEVGHTLGLRHNFRGSVIHTLDQNQDTALTGREGLSNSVMDYVPANIARKGQPQGEYHQSTLGPYDYWAIEYAYKPIDARTPEEELPELRRIASRAAEPLLAYATDEDAGVTREPFEMDPTANRFDLGTDPIAFASLRVELSREIVDNLEAKLVKPGDGYQALRRAFAAAFGQQGQAMRNAAKYIGGISYYRDHAGDPNGRMPYEPVPASRQKEAMNLLRRNVFAAEAFAYSPALMNKLTGERYSDAFPQWRPGRMDVPLHDMVLSLQRSLLDRLLHPVTLSRLLDSEMQVAKPADVFRIGDLFTGLQEEIWSEAASGKPVNSHRRALQREHLRRLTNLVLRDASAPEDARTMARYTLSQLQARVRGALARGTGMPLETRAHYSESMARIDECLKAQAQRTAF